MVMAPMTRNRASESGAPTAIMVEYYQQRATAGLIVSESAPVSQQGVGYPHTPGLFAPPENFLTVRPPQTGTFLHPSNMNVDVLNDDHRSCSVLVTYGAY